jgi:hypothetical protein
MSAVVADGTATLLATSTVAVTATAAAVGVAMQPAAAGVGRELMKGCHDTRHVSAKHFPGCTGNPIAEITSRTAVADLVICVMHTRSFVDVHSEVAHF